MLPKMFYHLTIQAVQRFVDFIGTELILTFLCSICFKCKAAWAHGTVILCTHRSSITAQSMSTQRVHVLVSHMVAALCRQCALFMHRAITAVCQILSLLLNISELLCAQPRSWLHMFESILVFLCKQQLENN